LIDLRPVLFILGVIIATFGPLLLLCALADLATGHPDWQVFVVSAIVVVLLGGLLAIANWGSELKLSLRHGFLLTVFAWISLSLLGAVPLYFSSVEMSLADAVFESVSGITTTGSTVLVGLDDMPAGVLLWRSLLHWFGGLGVIAMGILLLPFLRISGMQLFRMENSDVGEKATARMVVMVRQIFLVYCLMTVFAILMLSFGDISVFDALNHALSAISTGGFSTHDASVGAFDSAYMEVVLVFFMLFGALTFTLTIQALRGRPAALFRDPQVRFYLELIALVIIVIATWRILNGEGDPLPVIGSTAFNVVSVMTTTGFASENYLLWGPFPEMMFFVVTLLGGCTGSTTGGIKAFRVLVLLKLARLQILTRLQPNRILRLTYDDRVIEDDIVRAVVTFVTLTFLFVVVFALALSACGLDFVTAFSGAAQGLANVGPGIGAQIGPAGNFRAVPEAAKWILSVAMVLGRLEILVVLVVLTPAFWRR
jgi:trk system potassium uptake protein TrkH